MSNVKAMPGVMATTNQPNEALIQALEDILSDARAGILQSLLATGFRADGLRMTAIIPHNNVYEVVGSLECLKQTYLNEWTEQL
jgi:hypothetical protein